ncbi:MAG TPA: endonuclease/exonuclease/phosphatase family protein [Burkholderiaceae bacterium]|nr:endonuclease/exonuclease/phosphatase family protein [Burkholderiaceae bacterium]
MATNPLNSTLLPSGETTGASGNDDRLRVATYNIHKGVRGVGPGRRLEIHNLGLGIEALDADLVFLQEVRSRHDLEARHFARTSFGWPTLPQAEFLAPEGYSVAYRTNAYTRGGEHGNALLSRWPISEEIGHHDVSDHRFEQRGLLHVPVQWQDVELHAIVAHFGLIHASRVRQVEKLAQYIEEHVPPDAPLVVAGDFNDWGERLDALMAETGLHRAMGGDGRRPLTFPSRVPVFALDRIYLRGLECRSVFVPRGTVWSRMSDHLPLVAEIELAAP